MASTTRSDRERQRPRKVGLVLSGSGARAAYQVGAYEVLIKDPRFQKIDFISSTSGGSINAALIASGKTPAQMMDFWYAFADTPPVHANTPFFRDAVRVLAEVLLPFSKDSSRTGGAWPFLLGRIRDHLLPDPGNMLAFGFEMLLTRRWDIADRFLLKMKESSFLQAGPLRDQLKKAAGGETLPNGPIHVAINTVDIPTCSPVRYVSSTAAAGLRLSDRYVVVDTITVDHVLSSAAIPLLFPTVTDGKRLLTDGGFLVNTALAPAVDLGADVLVPIIATAKTVNDLAKFDNLSQALERIADALIESHYDSDRKLLLERNKLSRAGARTPGRKPYSDVVLYRPVRPPTNELFDVGAYLYFARGKLQEMYTAGKEMAAEWLKQGPLEDQLRVTERPT